MRFRGDGNVFVTILLGGALFLPAASVPAQEVRTPYVASDPAVVARMLALAALKDGETAVDLGSGDGRIVLEAVRSYPNARAWGVEIDAALVNRAKASAAAQGLASRAQFFQRNAFDADLRKVDVIFLWLLPELQRLLRTKILAEAKPGTRVIAHYTDMGSWQADLRVEEGGRPVLLWVVPARLAGNWSWTLPGPGGKGRLRYAAVIEQNFQKLEAAIRVGSQRTVLRELVLRGTEISFKLPLTLPEVGYIGHEFSGTVTGRDGGRIEGKVKLTYLRTPGQDSGSYESLELPWSAERTRSSAYFAPTGLPVFAPQVD